MATHNPLPWQMMYCHGDDAEALAAGGNPCWPATKYFTGDIISPTEMRRINDPHSEAGWVAHGVSDEDARLIVTAVNNHAGLRARIAQLLSLHDYPSRFCPADAAQALMDARLLLMDLDATKEG